MEIGEPDFPTPQPVIDAAQSSAGQRPVITQCARHTRRCAKRSAGTCRVYGLDVAPERIIVTAGGSAALLLTCALLVGRDDEILLTDPSYPAIAISCG